MPEDPYTYIVATYQAPPSPDYMPGPEEPQSPHPLDFIPEPMYPEYMPLEDEILPAKEQPLPATASPIADSPGYVPESDLEEEPEADDDEDLEEDPADHDDDEEEEEEPFGDDADGEDEDEDEDGEEEESPSSSGTLVPYYTILLLVLTPASVLPALPPASPTHPLGYRGGGPTKISYHLKKRLGIDLGPRCEVGESLVLLPLRPLGCRAGLWVLSILVTELAAVQEQDTQDIYGVIEDTQGRQTQIYQRVETLVDGSQYHYETATTTRPGGSGFPGGIGTLHGGAAYADFDIHAVTIRTCDNTTGTAGAL
ncbi:hypothetical protein Tco_0348314 [Tanacetum coccineum]